VNGRGHGATAVLSAALLLIGIALIGRTIAAGGGVASIGVLLGVLFLAAGAGRLWLAARIGRDS
jgi:hypothetical protein